MYKEASKREELQGTQVLNISGDQEVDPTNYEVRTRRDEKRGKIRQLKCSLFQRVVAAPKVATTSERKATKLQRRPRF